MNPECTFSVTTTRFDEHYAPATTSRTTTNFANLARGENRQQNLRNALEMIDHRFNNLVHWDNPRRDRYRLTLDIVSADLQIDADDEPSPFPIIEVLDVQIADTQTGEQLQGLVGNNFSSYIRDYDFSVRLPRHRAAHPGEPVPEDFGELHGKVFRRFLDSPAYRTRFDRDPVICLSVSTSQTYRRGLNEHPILGVEYQQGDYSLTDQYFAKMGLQVRYFMPPGAVAPLAFYHQGDLLNDHTSLELAGTIATMETFQKIYRPEIYNANSPAADELTPSLEHRDYSVTQVAYDREERSRLAVTQGRFTDEYLMQPYSDVLERWVA